jgi:hypothetical protein
MEERMSTEKLPWDVDVDATKVRMERFIRALVVVDGHFTDSFSLASVEKPSRGVTVFFRIWIKPGTEQRFLALAGVDRLRPPPFINLNMDDMKPAGDRRSAIVRES